MAAEGIRFSQWYSGESLCTPSRAAIMTGRLPIRSGMVPTTNGQQRVLSPTSIGGLPANETTLAEALTPLGYTTHISGKWHLGINHNSSNDGFHLPKQHGFNSSGLVLPFTNHWRCDEARRHLPAPDPTKCFLYQDDRIQQQPIDHSNLTTDIVASAKSFIDQHLDEPFFAYIGFAHMHVAMFNNERYTNTSENGIWGDGVRELSDAVDNLLDHLVAKGIANNTLVMLTSDHGPHIELCLEGGRTGGLKGGKSYSSWEGGLRVPGIAWWPGVIRPGQVTDELASSMDMFATAVDFAGGQLAQDRVYDGASLRSILTETGPGPHEALFHYCASRLMAVRYKDYKLTYFSQQLPFDNYTQVHCTAGSPHGEFFQDWDCLGDQVTEHAPPLIYHIAQDPGELYPAVVEETCSAEGQVLSATGMPGAGFVSKQLPTLDECRAWCCNTSNCGSVTYVASLNYTSPACQQGQPCCFLNPLHPGPLAPRPDDVIVAFVSRQGTGPLADIVTGAYAAVEQHFAHLQRGVTQLEADNNALQPCCHDAMGKNDPEQCGCNYNPSDAWLTHLHGRP
eukprot:TRINITY_DN11979_c1_g5_i1.p1 TRINITY_DN11979_c1_g5~~TRINITY_DN11979_c1_g5_i1.p1  ORF type:complete len:565 (+),score=122.76 TRINITY_DN11979_c1_g5_i1:164-1858(+)